MSTVGTGQDGCARILFARKLRALRLPFSDIFPSHSSAWPRWPNLLARCCALRALQAGGMEDGRSEAASSKGGLPPSQMPHTVWLMTGPPLDETISSTVVKALAANVQPLLARGSRGSKGDTDNFLGAVVFHLLPVETGTVETADARPPIDAEAVVVQGSPSRTVSTVTTMSVLHILLIYEGLGRVRSKVKRSVDSTVVNIEQPRNMIWQPAQFVHALTSSLRSSSLENALELIRMPTCRVASCWPPPHKRDLVEYLILRLQMAGGMSDPTRRADMTRLGLDLLGPRRPPPPPLLPLLQPAKRLKHTVSDQEEGAAGASSTGASAPAPRQEGAAGASATAASAPAPPPETSLGSCISPLQALLTFDGELSPAIASDRAAAICTAFHELTKELCLTKLHLQYYEQRDALEAQVHSNART